MSEDTKRVGIITFGMMAVLIALIAALYSDCENTDAKKLECIKLGHAPAECGCMFELTKSEICDKK